jgi:hypothetical protein
MTDRESLKVLQVKALVVELLDDADDLIGYGVCLETTRQVDPRMTQTDYKMQPEVYGVRSSAAHAAAEVAP